MTLESLDAERAALLDVREAVMAHLRYIEEKLSINSRARFKLLKSMEDEYGR